MSEVAQQQSPEDLSKLKGPKWWYGWVALICVVAGVLGWHLVVELRGKVHPLFGLGSAIGVIVSLIASLSCSIAWWFVNRVGHTVWWWKDGDRLRVTTQEYPTQAKGLVIEVLVKARPTFTIRWGGKGWCSVFIRGDGWVVNLKGERLRLGHTSQAALDNEGLTVVVVDFLFNAGLGGWRIVPLDAGRVLRFVDQLGCGIDMEFDQFAGVDLEEILRSRSCADYHKRMQDQAREHAEVRDQAWSQLIWCLKIFRADAGNKGGRPKSKVAALIRVRDVLVHLHRNLPPDSPLREQHLISGEALEELAALIAAEEAKLTPAGASAEQGV